jgi:hypothetical protein|tara:strand:+ start:3514 stop:3903 length:390 start_codon:yes stop_codon:yes gene_type:complete
MEGHLIESLGWYALGIFSYRIGTSLFNTSRAMLTFSEAVYYSLTVLKISHDNILSAQELKIEAMKNAGVEQELIDASKKVDNEFLETWRITSLYVLQKSLPPAYKPLVSFKNWFQAMRYLDKRLRKNTK